jgi:competence protein ComFB
MEIRNTLEIAVSDVLEKLLHGRKDICRCEHCQLDMKAYALNRLPPRYVVGERGLIHSVLNSVKDAQSSADLVRTVSEAITAVASRPRSGHASRTFRTTLSSGQACPLPQIRGELYKNSKFDPATGAKIRMLDVKGRPLMMKSPAWPNPVTLSARTMGLFSFWPSDIPQPKTKRTAARSFAFKLEIKWGRKKMLRPFVIRFPSDREKHCEVRISPVFLDSDG